MKMPTDKPCTNDLILETALSLFSSKGFTATTTRELARQAGIAEVTLFRHFASKEAILQAVINRYTFLPTLRELLPEVYKLPLEDGLIVIAERLLDFLMANKDWIRIMHAEVQRSGGVVHSVYHSFIDDLYSMLACYFKQMLADGRIREFDPEFAARSFHGILFGFFTMEEILMRKTHKPTDQSTAIPLFVNVFVHGIAGSNHNSGDRDERRRRDSEMGASL